MTVYYREEENVVEANNIDEAAYFDDSGTLVIDCDDVPRGVEKLEEFARVFTEAAEANRNDDD